MRRALVLILLLTGCGVKYLLDPPVPPEVGDGGIADLGTADMYPPRKPSDHPPMTVMINNGGPVLSNIELWTVVFKGEEATGAQVQQFNAWLVKSDYWTRSLAEYGVGAGTVGASVIVLPMTAPASVDDSSFAGFIDTGIGNGTFPKPNANTVFAFIIPPTTKQTMGGAFACTQYLGYHSQTFATNSVPYIVDIQCPGLAGDPPFGDDLTDTMSHEAAEVATDPLPFSAPAWRSADVALGEVGDLCNAESNVIRAPTAGIDHYRVTRLFSSKNAGAGNADPCVPAPTIPYFNVGIDPLVVHVQTDRNGDGSTLARLEPFAFGEVGLIKWEVYTQGNGVSFGSVNAGFAGQTFPLAITVDKRAQTGTYPLNIYCASQRGENNEWFGTLIVE